MADRLAIEVTGFEFLSAIDRAASSIERLRALMELIGALLRSYGYAVVVSAHDCGELAEPLRVSAISLEQEGRPKNARCR